MRVAIIDHEFDYSREIYNVKRIIIHETTPSSTNGHGEECLNIIQSYTNNVMIYCINIPLNNPDSINYFINAIAWCIDEHIDIINLSVGTNNYMNFKKIGDICYKAMMAGVLIVAAVSNDNSFTYPACCPFVLGVRYHWGLGSGQYVLSWYPLNGIDILIDLSNIMYVNSDGIKRLIQKSNSYAAAYMTALIAGEISHTCSIYQIKLILQKKSVFNIGHAIGICDYFSFRNEVELNKVQITDILNNQLLFVTGKNDVLVISFTITPTTEIKKIVTLKDLYISNGYNAIIIAKYTTEFDDYYDQIDYIYLDDIDITRYIYTISKIRKCDIVLTCNMNVAFSDINIKISKLITDLTNNKFIGLCAYDLYRYIENMF